MKVLVLYDYPPSPGWLKYGFNEWIKAQDGKPMGQDWQSWSAALYIYAVKCVEDQRTPFFDEISDSLAETQS